MFLVFIGTVLLAITLSAGQRWLARRRDQRLQRVLNYAFAHSYAHGLQQRYPQLGSDDLRYAETALRHYFTLQLLSGRTTLAMPSRLAGALWQAFSQDAARYVPFCQQVFGRVLPMQPVPSAATGAATGRRSELQATWNAAIRYKRLLPHSMLAGMPLLFALDAHTRIEDGWRYSDQDVRYWAVAMVGAVHSSEATYATYATTGSGVSPDRDDHRYTSSIQSADLHPSYDTCSSGRSDSSDSSGGSCDSDGGNGGGGGSD